MTEKAVYAAGAVVWRRVEGKIRILLIHRTRYADVTLPKGKVDPGEMLAETAIREVREETGLALHLGLPVGMSRYIMPSGKQKVVHYWESFASDEAIAKSDFVPNKEIAGMEWVSPKKALSYLSYPVDVEIVENFLAFVESDLLDTFALIALRHAKAAPRGDEAPSDASRPLTERGQRQAAAIAGALAAFGPRRIVSSTAVRCITTVVPVATRLGREIKRTDAISQDAWENGTSDVRGVVGKRIRSGKTAILCSHGPVLPDIVREIAIATGTPHDSSLSRASSLETGAFSVVHLSSRHPGSGIITIETHASSE